MHTIVNSLNIITTSSLQHHHYYNNNIITTALSLQQHHHYKNNSSITRRAAFCVMTFGGHSVYYVDYLVTQSAAFTPLMAE